MVKIIDYLGTKFAILGITRQGYISSGTRAFLKCFIIIILL